MFGLGAGTETPALHNPNYDFPEDLIDTGIKNVCLYNNKDIRCETREQ